jgi:itaconyl-CoA hydratase
MADAISVDELRRRARLRRKGRHFEDFRLDQSMQHHWGRTIGQADNLLFSSLTLHYNPLYLNEPYARAEGHPDAVINPYLVFLTVFGMSVEDLSEAGGAFLGVDDLVFHRAVHPGETLTARSAVVALRESTSRPGFGIATWRTEGLDDAGMVVIEFVRTNMVPRGEVPA